MFQLFCCYKCIFAVLSPLALDLHRMKHCKWITPDNNDHYWAPSLTIWSEEKRTEILFLPMHQVYLDYLLHRKGKTTDKWWRWESFAGSSTYRAPQSFSAHSDVAAHKHGPNTGDGSNSHQSDKIHLLSTWSKKKLTPPFVSELCLISLWEQK